MMIDDILGVGVVRVEVLFLKRELLVERWLRA